MYHLAWKYSIVYMLYRQTRKVALYKFRAREELLRDESTVSVSDGEGSSLLSSGYAQTETLQLLACSVKIGRQRARLQIRTMKWHEANCG